MLKAGLSNLTQERHIVDENNYTYKPFKVTAGANGSAKHQVEFHRFREIIPSQRWLHIILLYGWRHVILIKTINLVPANIPSYSYLMQAFCTWHMLLHVQMLLQNNFCYYCATTLELEWHPYHCEIVNSALLMLQNAEIILMEFVKKSVLVSWKKDYNVFINNMLPTPLFPDHTAK